MSTAETSYEFSGTFEAELLAELMLRYWKHPFADDAEFRNQILESATEVLRESMSGTRLLESLPPDSMNLVAAIWYAEWASVQQFDAESESSRQARQEWLDNVRRAIPSCFCDPDQLA